MRQGNDLDVILEYTRGWAETALREPPTGAARTSRIEVGGGMATILLSVGGSSVLRVWRPDGGDHYRTEDLGGALETVRAWAERALRGR